MTSIYEKAVLITSGQVVLNRAPPGLAFLAGICEEANIEYQPYDLNLFIDQSVDLKTRTRLEETTPFYPVTDEEVISVSEEIVGKFVDQFVLYDPDLIMISVMTYYQNFWAELLLKTLKKHGLRAKTIIGGAGVGVPHTENKTFARCLLDNGLVDYYVLGEGDMVLRSFVRGDDISGLNYEGKDKSLPGFVDESFAPQIDNLDECPWPSYRNIKVNDYLNHEGIGEIAITGSRGCVRRCTFCDVGYYWKKFRFRSGNNIAEEIRKHYLETGTTRFLFTDSLVNGSLKAFYEMLDGVIKLRQDYPEIERIHMGGQFIVRPKKFHREEMFKAMGEAGLVDLMTGVESGSERVREHLGKKFSNEDIDWHMEMCSKYGIQNVLLMLIGYPTETREDFDQSLDMLYRYQKYHIDKTIREVSESGLLAILKNTPLHNMINELKITGVHEEDYFNMTWMSGTNPDLTVKERYQRLITWHRAISELGYWRSPNTRVLMEEVLNSLNKLIRNQNKEEQE